MQCHLYLVACILFIVCFTKANVGAFIVNGRDNSYEADNQKEVFYFASFRCPTKFGFYPDVTDCSRFYACSFGFHRRMPCPMFSNFDMHKRRCVAKGMAICDRGEEEQTTQPPEIITEPTPDDNAHTQGDGEFVCPEMSGSFTHSTDCNQYYACESYVPSVQTCPDLELFDGVMKQCKPENEVECGSRNRPTKPTAAEEITISEVSEVETPETTTEDLEDQTGPETDCDEDDVECIIAETGEIPKWFKCPIIIGSYRHPLSKKLFIFCINRRPSVKRCGQNLVYSKEVRTCVPPE